MKTLDWYFDFISPFAYLQSTLLGAVAEKAAVHRKPILFAGLLSRWGQLGPAEIEPKRIWTFQHCVWLAERHGIVLKMPPMHPFNPLPLLRLSTALGNTGPVVDRLFRFVWVEGHLPTERSAWDGLLAELAIDEAAIQSAAVKETLRGFGADAIAAGVFGVPTAVVDHRSFWGFDSHEMLREYLDGSTFFASAKMKAATTIAVGPMRPRAVVPS